MNEPLESDMPQPLSRVKANVEIRVYPGVLNQHPEFALASMKVIAEWADIDGNLAGILANLLRTDIAAGAAMYLALNGGEAKKQVMLAAAKATLPEWQFILLQAVLRAIKPSRDQRNNFAHHVWGVADGLPKALLLMSPEVVVQRNISFRQLAQHLPGGRGVIAPKDYDRERVFVYRKADFDRAKKQADEAGRLVRLLYGAIGETRNEQSRRLLLLEPLMQQALQPWILENSPEVQAQLRPPADGEPPAKGISEVWDRSLGRIP